MLYFGRISVVLAICLILGFATVERTQARFMGEGEEESNQIEKVTACEYEDDVAFCRGVTYHHCRAMIVRERCCSICENFAVRRAKVFNNLF